MYDQNQFIHVFNRLQKRTGQCTTTTKWELTCPSTDSSGQLLENSSHHVMFEDSLDHRSEHFNHDHRPRPLPTVLQHTEMTRSTLNTLMFNYRTLAIGLLLFQFEKQGTSPYRRTHTGQVVGGCFPEEEQWPEQKPTHTHIHTHTHTHTHTDRWIFPYPISYLPWLGASSTDLGCQVQQPGKNSSQVSYTNITTSLSIKLFCFAQIPPYGHRQQQSKTHKNTSVTRANT